MGGEEGKGKAAGREKHPGRGREGDVSLPLGAIGTSAPEVLGREEQ